MRAVEFKTRIEKDRIAIPEEVKLKMGSDFNKEVRIILLIEDIEQYTEEIDFKQNIASEFLKGYSDSDSVYDEE